MPATTGTHNSLVKVDDDTYALAYEGGGDNGKIKTFTIPADGSTITKVANIGSMIQIMVNTILW